MKPIILAALFALGVVLVAIAGSRRIERTRARWEADNAHAAEVQRQAMLAAEVPHQDADEEWAEVVQTMHAELEADPAHTLPPPALDLRKHQPEVPLDKPVPWHRLPADPDEATPLAGNRPMPYFDPDLDRLASITRAFPPDLVAILREPDPARAQEMLDARYGRTS